MNKEALSYKMISVFIWALYPVFIALGSSEDSLGWFIVFVHISAATGALICGWFSLKNGYRKSTLKSLFKTTKSLNIDEWGFVFTAGFCATLYNLCFLYAMVWTSKAGVTVIIETAPVIAMVLTSTIVIKKWEAIGLKHAIISAMILFGVALIVLADQQDFKLLFNDYDAYIKTGDFMSLVGCIVAMLGSIMSATCDLMKAQVGNATIQYIDKNAPRYDRDLSAIMFGEFLVRIIALPMAFIILFLFNDVSDFSKKDMIYACIVGFFIFNLGSITYAASLLKSTNPAIALLDYLSPPISIVILVLLGLSTLNSYLLIGTAFIIFGNLFLLVDKKPTTAPTIHHP